MEGKKSSEHQYKSVFSKISNLQFGKREVAVPTQINQRKTTSKGRSSKWITLLGLIVLLGVVKLFNLDGRLKDWFNGYQSQFQQPAPEAIEAGTVCNLLIALEEEKSILLQDHEEQVMDRLDTMILQGLSPHAIDSSLQQAERVGEATATIDINELVYFEALTQERARLLFADGRSEVYDLSGVLQLIRDRDKCHFFQAVSFEGQAYEYFNILYTEGFEKVSCQQGTFFRARLNISESEDPAVRILRHCGTDLFSSYIYQKTRRRLEFLNPNSDYSYRTEVLGEGCGC
ncbi:hypothetical protein [Flavilitoribacter nigricans]|uniref:Uncharacterized protein n=1 Tax=Flavilitoribacter nigricans (strain ATCC 23147 / DSM 23189 / NBRC 102662 / NCIMB 1420 / SS-2) TaxID=1122177 RepID=A0A2D0N2P8_FLAN2|nr:hypothetical protein [Flavilitoribacter nigricans]PHN02013.1 hypothetical protein CRP01_34470 [Flavilitoribacter nigricans DSM 23189 = NBRC 102662]